MAKYWNTHDAKELRRGYDAPVARFPQSEWALRAKPCEQTPL